MNPVILIMVSLLAAIPARMPELPSNPYGFGAEQRVTAPLAEVTSDTSGTADTTGISGTGEVSDAPARIEELRRRIDIIRSLDLGRAQYIPRLGLSDAEYDRIRRQHAEELDILRLTWMIRLLEMMDDPAFSQQVTVVQPTRDARTDRALPPDVEVRLLTPDTLAVAPADTHVVTRVDTVFVDRVQTEIIELRRMLETGVFRAFSIVFEFDRHEILPSSHPILDEAGRLLADNPEIMIEVQGHTDNTGPREYNLQLSLRRAQSVRSYLLDHFPEIEAGRILAAGYGPDRPITGNRTPTERALNRRVEFRIIEP